MADTQVTSLPTPYAPPMAKPGYGKRSAPDQKPYRADDFADLPPREAAIATHIDRLPDGAAIDTKTLAKQIEMFGQQAIRTTLNALVDAGHLRRHRDAVGDGYTRWVSRTYFSRTPRPDSWWRAFLAGTTVTTVTTAAVAPSVGASPPAAGGRSGRETAPSAPLPAVPPTPSAPPPAVPPTSAAASVPSAPPRTATRERRSAAYEVLAGLALVDRRLTLSAADCVALEPLAAEWLARDATTEQLRHALTAGLPAQVHHPAALLRTRLVANLPPEPIAPTPVGPPRLAECAACQAPGYAERFTAGYCPDCRHEPSSARAPEAGSSRDVSDTSDTCRVPRDPEHVHERVDEARRELRRGRPVRISRDPPPPVKRERS